MSDSFAERFAALHLGPGPLVVGIDPSGALLRSWGLGDDAEGLDRFTDLALDGTTGAVGIVKVQSAFYERHGWQGMRALSRLVVDARGAGLLVILDAKRGDVGSTNDAYAEAFLGADAPLGADALTVHPYLGLGAMQAYVERADRSGSCVLVVARSTNPDGRAIQTATTTSGRRVEQLLLDEIGELNTTLAPGRVGPVGAVVGPTHRAASPGGAADLDLPANALFLAPGLGAQGATVADVARLFAGCPDRVMPSASRSLLEHGPDRRRLHDAIAALAGEVRDALAVS